MPSYQVDPQGGPIPASGTQDTQGTRGTQGLPPLAFNDDGMKLVLNELGWTFDSDGGALLFALANDPDLIVPLVGAVAGYASNKYIIALADATLEVLGRTETPMGPSHTFEAKLAKRNAENNLDILARRINNLCRDISRIPELEVIWPKKEIPNGA